MVSFEEKKGESSSETDEEEDKERTPNSDISHILESEDEVAEFIHRYSVEIISENTDKNEPHLILHWAVGRKTPGEWTRPDDSYLPKN